MELMSKEQALQQECPVPACKAAPEQSCHSTLVLRSTGQPFGDIEPHFERRIKH